MFNYHKNCLFCSHDLPNSPSGVGEHVFPQCVFGFWRIYDVCSSCMKHFGDNVDHLPLKDTSILQAMTELGFSTGGYLNQLPYEGKDTIYGQTVKMYRREDRIKVKTNFQNPDFFECSEEDWEKIGVAWLRKQTDFPSDEFNQEIDLLKAKYISIPVGEIASSEKLGVSIRKGSVSEAKVDSCALPSISPLIAKIAVSFLNYALPPNILSSFEDFSGLVNHARNLTPLIPNKIMKCRIKKERTFFSFHRARVFIGSDFVIVDVTFFGAENWRIFMNSSRKIDPQKFDEIEYNGIDLILDFKNQAERKKIIALFPTDKSTPIWLCNLLSVNS